MCKRKKGLSDDKILQFISFFGPWGQIIYCVFRRRTGENMPINISEGHHTTPALTSIESCMSVRASFYKLTNRSLRDFPL